MPDLLARHDPVVKSVLVIFLILSLWLSIDTKRAANILFAGHPSLQSVPEWRYKLLRAIARVNLILLAITFIRHWI